MDRRAERLWNVGAARAVPRKAGTRCSGKWCMWNSLGDDDGENLKINKVMMIMIIVHPLASGSLFLSLTGQTVTSGSRTSPAKGA